ncbi:hypothetical protein SVA_2807 [Sulfurifustis variabilis]|uniref:Uncharacterized protein n=1 Tax=Sulfurifustis variabilis TaxID=1675686 RepID=A0A1B4V7C1_9GAMM|nr:hypothetical protein [Sulfurifustis variabilis]BAU49355.1 hypothetical protein SVA_2807 [Sulfurifustis variabilis]
MKRAEAWLGLIALVLGGPADAGDARRPPKDAVAPPAEASPSLDLLEFLGSWETATGPWDESLPDREPRADGARGSKETHRD